MNETMTLQQKPEGGLLQSRGWAVFQKAVGREVIAITAPEKPLFGIVHELPFVGRYLYVPRGAKDIDAMLSAVRAVAQRRGCAWLRIEPLEKHPALVRGAVPAPHDMQPRCVLQCDLAPDDDALLAQMKSKTRYNIRLARKRDVAVRVYRHGDAGADVALAAFIGLVKATAQRKGVHFHDEMYYREMFARLQHDDGADIMLYAAYYDDQIIAANIVTIYDDTATYLHGATADAHRNLMAPFLLQWRQIIDARKRGCRWYDFGGFFIGATDPGKAGISRFKRGFAPDATPLCLSGTYDLPLVRWRYRLYRIMSAVQNLRKRILS